MGDLMTDSYIKGDGFGYADETLSARAWRLRALSRSLFFWQEDHCKAVFASEINNK